MQYLHDENPLNREPFILRNLYIYSLFQIIPFYLMGNKHHSPAAIIMPGPPETATKSFHVYLHHTACLPHAMNTYLNPDGASNSCVDIFVLVAAKNSPESGPVKGRELL
jgi:hypothetical protein